jgi:predicted nucleic acid-binding protein
LSLVLDSSVALSWCFEDERTAATLAVLEQVTNQGALAPALWPLEVLNALVMAERRKRVTTAQRHLLAEGLQGLPVRLDQETAAQAWSVTLQLAEKHRLTLYDAAYLELAERMALPLATLDQELRAAASSLGISLLGISP